jgi:hypothetical protein
VSTARPKGRGRTFDRLGFRGGSINSLSSRIVADSVHIHGYPVGIGTVGEVPNKHRARRLINTSALPPHVSPFEPSGVGALLSVGEGNYEAQGRIAVVSAGVHVGGVYRFRSANALIGSSYEAVRTITNVPHVATNLPTCHSFGTGNLWSAIDAACTITNDQGDFTSGLAYTTFGSGTLAVDAATHYDNTLTVTGAAITLARVYRAVNPIVSGGGSIGTLVGVDVGALTAGAVNYGIRNLSPTTLQGDATLLTNDRTYTATPQALLGITSARTITANFASATLPPIADFNQTMVLAVAGGETPYVGIRLRPTITNSPSGGTWAPTTMGRGFSDVPNFVVDTIFTTFGDYRSFNSAPVFSAANAGTATAALISGFVSNPTIDSASWTTISNYTHFRVIDPGAVAVLTQIGLDIPALTALSPIGVRNLNPTQLQSAIDLVTNNITYVASPTAIAQVSSTVTLTANFSSASLPALLDYNATLKLAQPGGVGPTYFGIRLRPTITNNASTGGDFSSSNMGRGFADSPTFTIDTKTGKQLGTYRSFIANPVFNSVNNGTVTSATVGSFVSAPTVDADHWTFTNWTHFLISTDVTATTQIGFDIPAFVNATTNIGIRNAASLVQSGASTFTAAVNITDVNVVLGTATGTQFGTATSQKLAFYGSTPIVQSAAVTDLGTVLSVLGLRASGTAYPITTSGAVALTGTVGLQADVTLLTSDRTYTSAPQAILGITSSRTITANYASALLPALVDYAPTLTLAVAGGATPFFGVRVRPTITNSSTGDWSTGTLGRAFVDNTVFNISSTQTGVTVGGYVAHRASVTFSNSSAGAVGTATMATYSGFSSALATAIATGWAVTTWRHFEVVDAADAKIGTQVGIDIPALTGGTTANIGIRNAASLVQSGASTFTAAVNITDVNVVLGTATGTQFGTATSQKLAFYGSTAVIQGSAFTQTYSTASHTHSNPTAATLTDNSGGTANTTLEALTSGAVYATDVAAIRNNFADLAAMCNKLTADLLVVRNVLNAVIDDQQRLGLFA